MPIPPGPLIGREEEQRAIRTALLHDSVRLLTLCGPAGVGKTRLAVTVAADPEVAAAFDDGVTFIDLAVVGEPNEVLPSIAEALGLRTAPAQFIGEQVVFHLRGRRTLLVLDNLEHVLDVAPELARLLANCPELKILATSRAALRLRWEHALPLAPLAVPHGALPTDAATAATYAGIALFVERARAVRPDFELTDVNAASVAEVCARLDGLPLALELAASRTKGLPLLVLLARLADRLELLQAGAADLPARHQTLRQALGWSYDLLDDEHRLIFRRLGAFVGGCTPEAAEAVCGLPRSSDVLEGLAALVHSSLLRLEEPGGGHPRYTMLETVRDFVAERLTLSGEAGQTRSRHATYYLALAEEAEPQLAGHGRAEWLERLEREHGNLRAALQWLIEAGHIQQGLRLGIALRRFWLLRGDLAEGRQWLGVLLALDRPSEVGPAHARALWTAGWLAQADGDVTEASVLYERSLALHRQAGDPLGIAAALLSLGGLSLDEGDLGRARTYFEESLALHRAAANPAGVAASLQGLARLALRQGDLAGAWTLLGEALANARQHDDDEQAIAAVLEGFACLAVRRGAMDRALRLMGAAESLRAGEARLASDWWLELEADQATARAGLGHAAAAAAYAAGRALGPEQALQLCLQEDDPPARAGGECPEAVFVNGCLEQFTRREREVIELAVRGWSNRQIASELVISERTAEGHIHNILSKLQLESRSQLAAWGVRAGLVRPELDGPAEADASTKGADHHLVSIQIAESGGGRARATALRN